VSLAEEIFQIASEYPGRGPRDSLEAVVRLRQRLEPSPSFPVIGVVGTNGKTSTATYLARLLTASGVRTGLYVSPHLSDWTERIRVDGEPCDPVELVEALTAVHEIAKSNDGFADLRFFDVLTLAAERLIGEAGAATAVFEAGIGGRLDAIRALEPRIVLLTSIAVDHAEILGDDPAGILAEKLLVTPPGGTVLSFHLGVELDELLTEVAGERGIRVVWVEPNPGKPLELPTYLRSALALAEGGRRVAAEVLDPASPGADWDQVRLAGGDLNLHGRFECGECGGVPYVLDAAHNEAAWRLLALELRRRFGAPPEAPPYLALISVSPDKRRDGLAAVLQSIPGLEGAIVTRHTALPAEDPLRLAEELTLAGLDAPVVEEVDGATRLAFERARSSGSRVLVFGSTHLVADVRRWLSMVGAGLGGDYGWAAGDYE
jgi:dihydrofolate synthase / folylpolyglutamate synthase